MPLDQTVFLDEPHAVPAAGLVAIAALAPEDRGPAVAALLVDCLTEAMVAMMFGIKPDTLKKWRTEGIGPPRTTEGNVVLFPIPLLKNYLLDRTRGAHASQRPPRR